MPRLTEFDQTKISFQDHALRSVIDRDSLIKGWEIYYSVALSEDKPMSLSSFHILHIVNGLRGEHIDPTTASIAHLSFKLMAYEPTEDLAGPLLKPLHGKPLIRAQYFCQAVDSVGNRDGDLDEKYPFSIPTILRGWQDMSETELAIAFSQTSQTFQTVPYLGKHPANIRLLLTTLEAQMTRS